MAKRPSLAETHPRLAAEWHPTRNGTLRPDDVTAGSGKKFWWLGACGHEWGASPTNRARGRRCPVCANQAVLSGFNDLATTHPALAAEWDYESPVNAGRTPSTVFAGTNRTVAWVDGAGHRWVARGGNRVGNGSGCPICSGRKVQAGVNDLATTHPALAAEWDYDSPTNDGRSPQAVSAGSNRKVSWAGPCGHHWVASVSSRSLGTGCPVCAGLLVQEGVNDMATTHPALAAEWDYESPVNAGRSPRTLVAGSNVKIGWRDAHGHRWTAAGSDRANRGSGCPVCSGRKVQAGVNDMATTHPTLAAEWDYDSPTNAGRSPQAVSAGTSTKIAWVGECGHRWAAQGSSRARGSGCPTCSGQRTEPGVNDLATTHPQLAAEWDHDATANAGATPADVSAGSNRPIGWICARRHRWTAPANARSTGGNGCPICAGRIVQAGVNDMATTHPELAAEWDYDSPTNMGLTPSTVIAGTMKVLGWVGACGHRWDTSGSNRSHQGTTCPYCANKAVLTGFNDMATTHPELASEWDYDSPVNAGRTPATTMAGTGHQLAWVCGHGHRWNSSGDKRVAGQRCPVCGNRAVLTGFNDMATTHPELASEWDYDSPVNAGRTPRTVTAGTNRQVAWIGRCGHRWTAAGNSRTSGAGCMLCFRHKQSNLAPLVALVRSLADVHDDLDEAQLYAVLQQSVELTAKAERIVDALVSGRVDWGDAADEIESTGNLAAARVEGEDGGDRAVLDPESDDAADSSSTTPHDSAEPATAEPTEGPGPAQLIVAAATAAELASGQARVGVDAEVVEFLLQSAVRRLWGWVYRQGGGLDRDALLAELAVAQPVLEGAGAYAEEIRRRFTTELDLALAVPTPGYWAAGQHRPNLMQRHVAALLADRRHVFNQSGTGAGKTLSALLSAAHLGAGLTLVVCPNAVVEGWEREIRGSFEPGHAAVVTRSWVPPAGGRHRFMVVNFERLSQPGTAAAVEQLLAEHRVDLLVVDEVHYAKHRNASGSAEASKRNQTLRALRSLAAERNTELTVLGMTATPVVNDLSEPVSLIEIVTGVEHPDLKTTATAASAQRIYQRLVTLGPRYRFDYTAFAPERIEVVEVDATHVADELAANSGNWAQIETILTGVRAGELADQARAAVDEGRGGVVIYTQFIDKGAVKDILADALAAVGLTVGFYDGEQKDKADFIDGTLDVLVATSAIGTGVDGLQDRCSTLLVNSLPWTHAAWEQLLGRFVRQGQTERVRVVRVACSFENSAGVQEIDEYRWSVIASKRTLAETAVDGVMPERVRSRLPGPQQMAKLVASWAARLEAGDEQTVERPVIVAELPADPEAARAAAERAAQVAQSAFSRMNRTWNGQRSDRRHERLVTDPSEWHRYHQLYRTARAAWPIIPAEWIADRILERARPDTIVGDFGCGELLLADRIHARQPGLAVHSFDHVAHDQRTTVCDVAEGIPLPDRSLDHAVFSLSLMGANALDALAEANRCLHLDGHLWIVEPAGRDGFHSQLRKALPQLGYAPVDDPADLGDRFVLIRAIKTAEAHSGQRAA